MIVVRDEDETLQVGETREDLVKYLADHCAKDYQEAVLAWFDAGAKMPLHIGNGESLVDEWKIGEN